MECCWVRKEISFIERLGVSWHLEEMHKQIDILIRGEVVSVDERVRDLILRLNLLPGIETYNSCQGEKCGKGYVQFGGEAAIMLIAELTVAIFKEQAKWKRKHRHVCRGCEGMSVQLEICGSGICVRWSPWDYRRLLRMVGKVARMWPIECAN